MYKVVEKHFRPTYRRGDLEAEVAIIDTKVFRTRKAAKEYIEGRLRGRKDAWRHYHKGDTSSWAGYSTGKTWVHENTGETCEETFNYELSKVEVK